VLLHNVLGRLSELSSNQPNAIAALRTGTDDATGESSFKEYRAKKDVKSAKFLGSPEAPARRAVPVFGSRCRRLRHLVNEIVTHA
jgi:hypothetical protein